MINIVAWLIFGLLTGLAANALVKPATGDISVLTLTAGVLGALIGGIVFLIFDTAPLATFNLWGMLVAIVGAGMLIGLARTVLGRPI